MESAFSCLVKKHHCFKLENCSLASYFLSLYSFMKRRQSKIEEASLRDGFAEGELEEEALHGLYGSLPISSKAKSQS